MNTYKIQEWSQVPGTLVNTQTLAKPEGSAGRPSGVSASATMGGPSWWSHPRVSTSPATWWGALCGCFQPAEHSNGDGLSLLGDSPPQEASRWRGLCRQETEGGFWLTVREK